VHSDEDFTLMMKGYTLVTLSVLYYMPDHRSIINEFLWQTLDLRPKYPRIEQFLDYWRREIEAPIYEVRISDDPIVKPNHYQNGVFYGKLN
jgi:uncharacterized protein Usg